jgi:glucokinase-like ROK family protein
MKVRAQKATHKQTKAYNGQLVFKTLYDHDRISRAEVARATGLTRTSVSELVNDLLRQRLVEEVGRGPSAGGKSPILLSVMDEARHLIGIDLANSEFRGAVVNLRGEVRHTVNLPVRSESGDKALALVYQLIDSLLAATDKPLLGIGIGTPGLIDTANGVVQQAVNLDWRDLPLGNLLHTRYNLPIYVANDSQLAALAEHTFGGGQDASNLVALKVGRGIGAGIVLNGQLFQGDGSGAGEIGHITIVENGQQCRCGNLGCLETVASTRAIVQQAQALAATRSDSLLHRFSTQLDAITVDAIHEAFEAGDDLARGLVLEAGRYLGIAAAGLVGALNVERILVVGNMARFGQPWLEVIRQEMRKRSLAMLAQRTQIEIGQLGPNVVILGASALLLTRELGLSLAR